VSRLLLITVLVMGAFAATPPPSHAATGDDCYVVGTTWPPDNPPWVKLCPPNIWLGGIPPLVP
jgi:hypothetical protein